MLLILIPFSFLIRRSESSICATRMRHDASLNSSGGLSIPFPRILLRSPANIAGTYTIEEEEDASNMEYLITASGETKARVKQQVMLNNCPRDRSFDLSWL